MNSIDLDFYSAACGSPRGLGRAFVPIRSFVRKLLKPMYQHQMMIFQQLVYALAAVEERQIQMEEREKNFEARLGAIAVLQGLTEAGFRQTEEGFRRTEEEFRRAEGMIRRNEECLRSTDERHEALTGRQDAVTADVHTIMALGWDHLALQRRLAVLEDRVEQLMQEREAGIAANQAARVGNPARVA